MRANIASYRRGERRYSHGYAPTLINATVHALDRSASSTGLCLPTPTNQQATDPGGATRVRPDFPRAHFRAFGFVILLVRAGTLTPQPMDRARRAGHRALWGPASSPRRSGRMQVAESSAREYLRPAPRIL
jgi:hypothetical protein